MTRHLFIALAFTFAALGCVYLALAIRAAMRGDTDTSALNAGRACAGAVGAWGFWVVRGK